MQITLRKSTSPTTYLLYGIVLPTVSTCIDLDVCMDTTLCFSTHVNYIVSKAKLRAN